MILINIDIFALSYGKFGVL